MLQTALTKRVMNFVYELHRDHTDSYGLPLVYHLTYIAERMRSEDTTAVALLHEAMERTDITAAELRKLGLPEKDIVAISLLTYRGERQYIRYIRRIRENRIAAAVKLVDLQHDCDITRMDSITDEDTKRLAKYEHAIKVLNRNEK